MVSQIKISAVGKKREGFTDALRPWTLWSIHSEAGVEFVTFDGVIADRAFNHVGEHASVEYEIPDRMLTSLTIERSAAA